MDPRLACVVADPGTDRAEGLWSDLGAHAHADPAAFNDKAYWWRDALLAALRAGVLPSPACTPLSSRAEGGATQVPTHPSSRLILHVDDSLRRLWTRDDVGRPLGLGAVVENMSSQGDLCSYRTFLASTAPIRVAISSGKGRNNVPRDGRSLARRAAGAAGGMAASAAIAALTAALGALGLGGDDAGDEESDAAWNFVQGDWVALSLLSSAAMQIQDTHFSRAGLSPLDQLYTKDEVARLLLIPVLSKWSSVLGPEASGPAYAQQDLDLLLLHLSRDLQSASIKDDVVKFSSRPGERVGPVTQHEQDIVQVRLTHALLEAQVASLQHQIEACTERAKNAVADKQASTAKAHLKTRKILLDVLDKRLGAEHNLSTVLLKLDQVSTDAKLAETYESASAALASVLADPRLQLDRVEKTMDDLQAGVQDAQAIEDAISVPAGGADDLDEDEIAAELAELEKEAKPKKEAHPVKDAQLEKEAPPGQEALPNQYDQQTQAPVPIPTSVPAPTAVAPTSEMTFQPAPQEAVREESHTAATRPEAGAQPKAVAVMTPAEHDVLPDLPSVPVHKPGKEVTPSEPERASPSASVQAQPSS